MHDAPFTVAVSYSYEQGAMDPFTASPRTKADTELESFQSNTH